MSTVGDKIKHYRKNKRLSLRRLGEMAHVSHSFISDIEHGRSNPSLHTLNALAKALNVPVSRLITKDYLDNTFEKDPTDQDLEEFLKNSNIKFHGEALDDDDKDDIINFLRMIRRKKQK